MKIYQSAEDYLERILMLSKEKSNVHSIDIANSFSYSKASISRAVKNLKENGYIIVNEDGSIILSEKGFEIANRMYERHSILTSFFIKLGVDKDKALEDACKVEHDLSEETFMAIKKHIENI